jgi:hypothetical protein
MADNFKPFSKSAPEDFRSLVRDGVKDAADVVNVAIDEGRKPGRPLDVLTKITREAPLGALLIAFLAGAMLARRR